MTFFFRWILVALFMNIGLLNAQYIYTTKRDTSDIYKCVTSLYKTNIFTCEKEELFNFLELGYYGVYKVDVDDANNMLFFSYNLMLNYAMINLSNPSQSVNLTRDIGSSGSPESGINYQTAYHHPSRTLYLFWRKFDPELDNKTGQIDSCAIVDPETGKNIKAFESFFDIYSATFSEDGKRLYATKTLPVEDRRLGKVVQLIINTEDAEVIESITPEDITPEAHTAYFFKIGSHYKGVGNKLLAGAIYGEDDNKKRYMYVYNMDTKTKSRNILYNIDGRVMLSSDGTKIIIDEYDPENRRYKGVIHILTVEWPENENDENIMQIDDGIVVNVPSPDKPKNYYSRTHSVETFVTNPDVLLYYYHNKPFESSYLIRLSDGKILRKGK